MKRLIVLAIALICVAGMVYAETTVLKNAEKLEKVVEMRADQFAVCTCPNCKCEKVDGACCCGTLDCTCEEDAEEASLSVRSEAEIAAFEGRVDAILASLGKTEIKAEEVTIEREPSPDVPLTIKKEIKQDYLQSYEEEEVTEVNVEKKVAPKKAKKATYGYSHK